MNVSVVVPVYNGARYVRKTLDALAGLEPAAGGSVEVVVVDDGSRDETPDIVAGYPFRLIRQDNRGPASARNTGWRASQGGVVCFTDSDCIPPPRWVGGLLGAFDDPDVGAVAGSYDLANPARVLPRLIQAEILDRHRRMGEFVRAAGTYNMAVRREVLEAVGGFDEGYPTASGEDNDLSYRIQKAGRRIAFRPGCRVAHHHPERVGKYLKSQFVHGYWRSRLYRRHPEFLAGDDYTRKRDLLDAFLATCAVLLVPFSIWHPLPIGVSLLFVLGVLLLVEAYTAGRLARAERDWTLLPAGAAVFTARAFARAAGWYCGLARWLAAGKDSTGGMRR